MVYTKALAQLKALASVVEGTDEVAAETELSAYVVEYGVTASSLITVGIPCAKACELAHPNDTAKQKTCIAEKCQDVKAPVQP
jgi:hypothetical protein